MCLSLPHVISSVISWYFAWPVEHKVFSSSVLCPSLRIWPKCSVPISSISPSQSEPPMCAHRLSLQAVTCCTCWSQLKVRACDQEQQGNIWHAVNAAKLPVRTVLPYVWIQQSAHSWRWHTRMPLLHIEYKYSPQICEMPAAHFLYPRNSSSKLRSLDWPSTSSVAPQTWNHLFSLVQNDRTREPSKYIKMLVETEKAWEGSKMTQA